MGLCVGGRTLNMYYSFEEGPQICDIMHSLTNLGAYAACIWVYEHAYAYGLTCCSFDHCYYPMSFFLWYIWFCFSDHMCGLRCYVLNLKYDLS